MNYLITDETLSIIPISTEQTKIVEKERVLLVDSKAFKIISENCKRYGGTYLGKTEISKIVLKCKCKVPIILDDEGKILLFPTRSKCQNDCTWLNYSNIRDYRKKGDAVIITFFNDVKISINISYYSFEKQMNKCHRLKLEYLEKKMSLLYRNVR